MRLRGPERSDNTSVYFFLRRYSDPRMDSTNSKTHGAVVHQSSSDNPRGHDADKS